MLKYRPEIDGLRAVAVLGVILFHSGLGWISGGFLGVDVFFVISGYLITSIILDAIHRGDFLARTFYERRARRILPALFFVMLMCIPIAWKLLLPGDLKGFGQSLVAIILFVSNAYFSVKRDYFAAAAAREPMLHTWSLGVEEQFYLLFPLLLLAIHKWGRITSFWVLAAFAITSLLLSEWGWRHHPVANFYLVPARAWELLVGALCAFRKKPQEQSATLSGLGLGLILLSFFAFDEGTPSPSLYCLAPTLGAALIILYGTPSTPAARILSAAPMVGIGLISYSAYLWHQPIFAFARTAASGEPAQIPLLLLCALTLGLAYLTWRFVERPFRNRSTVSLRLLALLGALVGAALLAFGIAGHFNNGYPNRNPLYARLASNYGLSLRCNGNVDVNAVCATGPAPRTAIFGNSYAMHLVEGYQSRYPKISLVQLTQDGCAPYPEGTLKTFGKLGCAEFARRAIATILTSPSITDVILSSPFVEITTDAALADLERTVSVLARTRRVIIIGPPPATGTDFGRCFLAHSAPAHFEMCDFPRAAITPQHFEIIRRLTALSERTGARFVDLTTAICGPSICRASAEGSLIYRDSGHLSREGSRYALRQFFLELPRHGRPSERPPQ